VGLSIKPVVRLALFRWGGGGGGATGKGVARGLAPRPDFCMLAMTSGHGEFFKFHVSCGDRLLVNEILFSGCAGEARRFLWEEKGGAGRPKVRGENGKVFHQRRERRGRAESRGFWKYTAVPGGEGGGKRQAGAGASIKAKKTPGTSKEIASSVPTGRKGLAGERQVSAGAKSARKYRSRCGSGRGAWPA